MILLDFEITFLSFYVVTVEGKGDQSDKRYKHFQTIDENMYEESALKAFLDGELARIVNRKVERHAKNDTVPTKLGHFIVEENHSLDSNPNYNLFQRIRHAKTTEEFKAANETLVINYVDTSAVRGGAFLVIQAKLRKYYDDPIVFVLKCDFEPKVASISDESTLIKTVEMAITTKNMKSIQYPYMEELGLLSESELKIHQASHARYFEDFLKFVSYAESMPEIVKSQVMTMVYDRIDEVFEEESEERQQFEAAMEVWAASPKREIQEHFSSEEVIEAAAQIVEHTPEIELAFKADHFSIKGMLADFGENLHIAKVNGRYVVMIEADTLQFEKGFSPIEFLKPDEIHHVIDKIKQK